MRCGCVTLSRYGIAAYIRGDNMNGDREFAHALADFLAMHTEQSSGYLFHLIRNFLRGATQLPRLEAAEKKQVIGRLTAEVAAHNDVPSFFQSYLLGHLQNETSPPHAIFYAMRYLSRSNERLVSWSRRQRLFAEIAGEAISGTELGFAENLYSQGVGDVFRWRGIPCFKTVQDLAIYQMLVGELRPRTIIELGSGMGGSALFLADLCASVGLTTQVISVDRQIGGVSDPRIDFVQADCQAWLEEAAKSARDFQRPCLLVEDFHGDLGAAFEPIDAILRAGDYLFIEDSLRKQARIGEVIPNRPYAIDSKYTDFFGINCTSAMNSIFVKQGDANPSQARREQQRLKEQDRAWRQRSQLKT
jgi:cephalosporin hydroxylase